VRLHQIEHSEQCACFGDSALEPRQRSQHYRRTTRPRPPPPPSPFPRTRGNTASVLRIVPYAAVHFASYEWFRRVLQEAAGSSSSDSTTSSSTSSSGTTPSSSSSSSAPAAAAAPPAAGRSSPGLDLLAGAASGAVAVLATYPLDLVRTRMAYTTTEGRDKATIRSALRRCLREDGARGLYRGAAPTLLGILPYAGLKFFFYSWCKEAYRDRLELEGERERAAVAAAAVAGGEAASPQQPAIASGGGGRLPLGMTLIFGGVSGLAAQTITYPLDVIRRQMQVAGLAAEQVQQQQGSGGGGSGTTTPSSSSSSSSSGAGISGRVQQQLQQQQPHQRPTIWGTAVHIFRESGVRGFGRGLTINFVKVVPSTAIGFTVYDHLKSYLGLDVM